MSAVAGNGEVRVEKVDKIRYVYNAVTRPSVYANRGTELPCSHWGQLTPMKNSKSFTNYYYLVLIYRG
jgi:hypothetical protein